MLKKNIVVIFLLISLILNVKNYNNSYYGLKFNVQPDYQVAVQFINDYAIYCNKTKFRPNVIKWINKRTDVTKEFRKILISTIQKAKKENPEYGLGFDPIFDAQDYPNQFEIDSFNEEYLIVKGINWPVFKLTIKLKKNWESMACRWLRGYKYTS